MRVVKSNCKYAPTPRQESVAILLASGHSIEQAARLCGLSVPAVKKWKRLQPGFMAYVRELRHDLTEKAAGILADGMTKAAGTLVELLGSKSEGIRLKAADTLLAHGHELNTLLQLQADVEELKAVNQGGNRATPRLVG
jgi:hypothetical protein